MLLWAPQAHAESSLQAAIDAAPPGATVQVAPGEYPGPVVLDEGRALEPLDPSAQPPTVTGDCTAPAITVPAGNGTSAVRGLNVASACPEGGTGIEVHGPGVTTLEENRIEGFGTGVAMVATPTPLGAGGVTLRSNRILGNGVGLSVSGPADEVSLFNDLIANSATAGLTASGIAPLSSAPVSATNVDIVGTAAPNPEVQLAGAQLRLDSSIIGAGGISAAGAAGCEITYSIGPEGSVGPSGCAGTDFQDTSDPAFADAANGDYGLRSASPGVDAGDPSPSPVLTDLLGAPREMDGDGDGEQRRDVGSQERRATSLRSTASADANTVSTYAKVKNLYAYLGITASFNLGSYILCVRGPGEDQCYSFKGTFRNGRYHDSVNWSRTFRYRGPGNYRVFWQRYVSGTQIGPPRSFHWGACAPRNLSMVGVWKPHRLIIRDRCHTLKGRVRRAFHVRNDGDIHIVFNPNSGGIKTLEIVARDQPNHLPRPRGGRRLRVKGVYVCDTFHGPRGHTEIHPIFREQYLNRRGRVLRTFTGGPQYPGTPRVNLTPKGRFHCR
jgi:hypothetical protein